MTDLAMTTESGIALDDTLAGLNAGLKDFVTLYVDGQLFGLPVMTIQDILRNIEITPVPMAPPEVAGVLNLRGRIVTAMDIRRRLGLPDRNPEDIDSFMNVVVEHQEVLYSLIVDSVGDVLKLDEDEFEQVPVTLDERWITVAKGIYRMDEELMVIADVKAMIEFNEDIERLMKGDQP